MLVALTHSVSPEINRCELSYVERRPIDVDRAAKQHEDYCNALRACGLRVVELSVNRSYPDATFVEDTAVVVDEMAVMARMGAASRRGEVAGIETVLAEYRQIARIRRPGTLEGGDVLRVGRKIFVGISPRTNAAGIKFLGEILKPFGYHITPVRLKGCLHLKSACTALDDDTLLVNPDWLDLEPFEGFRIVPVPADEPWAANVLRVDGTILMHAGFSKTAGLIRSQGFRLETVDISELLKAEAGMTCSSIIFTHPV